MHKAVLDGVALEYEISGTGEPIVMLPHGAGVDWFKPLAEEPALTGYQRIRYHRAGYRGSSPLTAPLTFEQEARNFRTLMRHLGLERGHILGHSASGCMVLQIALDVPEVVQSIALLEAALMDVPSPPEVPQAMELYRAGETEKAVATFLRGTCGPGSREVLEATIPGPSRKRCRTRIRS